MVWYGKTLFKHASLDQRKLLFMRGRHTITIYKLKSIHLNYIQVKLYRKNKEAKDNRKGII